MKKISNFSILFVCVFCLIVVIGVFTVIKVENNHEEKLMYAMKSKVEYNAKRCYLENKCADVISLNTLYENDFLSEVINPVTKEVIDSNMEIKYENDNVVIDWDKYLGN